MSVLFALEDENAIELMSTEAMRNPRYALEAAIALSGRHDWEAITYLRDYISRPYGAYIEDFTVRVAALEALIKADHVPAKNLLANLMNLSQRDVMVRGAGAVEAKKQFTIMQIKFLGCRAIGRIGNRNLMSILAPLIEDPVPIVGLAASEAALAISNPEYHKRYIAVTEQLLPLMP